MDCRRKPARHLWPVFVGISALLIAATACADVEVEKRARCRAEDKGKPCDSSTRCTEQTRNFHVNGEIRTHTYYECVWDAALMNQAELAREQTKKRRFSCHAAPGARDAPGGFWLALFVVPLLLRRRFGKESA